MVTSMILQWISECVINEFDFPTLKLIPEMKAHKEKDLPILLTVTSAIG